MARPTRKDNPTTKFMKGAPLIWGDLVTRVYKPLAWMVSDSVYSTMSDAVTNVNDTLGIPNSRLTDRYSFSSNINRTLESAYRARPRLSSHIRVIEQKGAYTFRIDMPSASTTTLFSVNRSLPGTGDLSSFASREQKLKPLVAGFKDVGINLSNLNGESTVLLPMAGEILNGEGSLGGQSRFVSIYADATLTAPIKSQVFSSKAGYVINITGEDLDIEVDIVPFVEVTVGKNLINAITETDNSSTLPYLSLSWMKAAAHSGISNSGRVDYKPVVDITKASRLLQDVKRTHGRAKPRVNSKGFCISNTGMPLLVPAIDNSAAYMKSFSSPQKTEDGYYDFTEDKLAWANKVLLVDWFNDFLMYTSSEGEIEVLRMLGYVALDESSEYILLNTPLHDRLFLTSMTSLRSVINAMVEPEEADKFLDASARGENNLDGGHVVQDFGSLIVRLVASPLYQPLNFKDKGFKHDSDRSPLLKHLFGIDLDEFDTPEVVQELHHVHAYLKALASKRKKIEMPVLDRLRGIEYFLVMANTGKDSYAGLQDEAIKDRENLQDGPVLDMIDVPNLDAGENIKGFMPHQSRIFSNMQRGATSDILDVAPGGGKSVLLLADILIKKLKNPKWKALVVTKPGLVKNFASEINFFTKGKVNVVVLRMKLLREMKSKLGIDTAEKLLKWVNGLPNNTVFLCGYTDFSSRAEIYPDLDMPKRIFRKDVGLTQFLHLIRIIGFEMVSCDESHLIKNMKSLRSMYSYSALAQAKRKIAATGTTVSNTATDLVGQAYGLNPLIFGSDVEKFKDRYQLAGGIIKSDQIASAIKGRLRRVARVSEAKKEDWSFILPDFVDEIVYGKMTDLQSEFYEKLLRDAQIELKARLEGKSPSATVRGEEDGDDEETEFEDDDDRIMAMAESSLAKVEQFIVAPDANEQYMSWEKKPRGKDLISPLVPVMDKQLDDIYRDPGKDQSNNKSAVFGIHKVASIHFIKHSRWKAKMIRYTAGDDDVIRKFKAEAGIFILIADSTSLREGENLQQLSYIFSTQAPWSPGNFEQLVSRMYRPDPKGTYNKDVVFHKWLVADRANGKPGISSVKLARLVSKAISSARLKYEGDSRWKNISSTFEELGLLKMSLKFIFESENEDLSPYLSSWAGFVGWETGLNQATRRKLAKQLEEENPGIQLVNSATGRVTDRSLFTKLAMREVTSTKTIQGSKKVYTPWIFGATPADPLGMGLEVVGSDDIEIGDYVMTEFGPGIIQGVSKNMATVEVYGLKKISLHRSRITKPGNPKGEVKLAELIKNPSAWKAESIGPFDVLPKLAAPQSLAPKPVLQRIIDSDPKQAENVSVPTPVAEQETPEDEQPIIEEIYTYLINGMPSLAVFDPPDSIYDLGWNHVESFISLEFRNWAIADKFIELLDKKYYLSRTRKKALDLDMDNLRDGKAMRLQRIPSIKVRNFFLTDHRKLGRSKDGRVIVNPYWVSFGVKVKLAFSLKAHQPPLIQWLKRVAAKNTSIKTPVVNDGFAINIFSTLNEAAADIRKLGQYYDIPAADLRQELREMRDDIRVLKRKKNRPTG